jgi:hypothetical protein
MNKKPLTTGTKCNFDKPCEMKDEDKNCWYLK